MNAEERSLLETIDETLTHNTKRIERIERLLYGTIGTIIIAIAQALAGCGM